MRFTRVFLAAFMLVLALAAGVGAAQGTQAAGREFFVSPSGSNHSPGSKAQPFATLEHALAQLGAGDTLWVRGGSYHERLINPRLAPGTQDTPIRVQAWPEDIQRPVVVGLFWVKNPVWVDFQGINVTWSDENAADEHMVKFSGGHHWSFTDAEVWGARSHAAILVTGESSHWLLSGLYVHDTHPTNDTNQDHLIYISRGAHHGVIERCVLVNSENGRAVKIGAPSADDPAPHAIQVRYNTMANNLGPSNVQLSHGAHDVEVHHNVMQRPGQGRENVTGYKLTGSDNVVRDNIVWESDGPVQPIPGLIDGGGNVVADPMFADPSGGNYAVMNSVVSDYGHAGS
jgi:hypothetical protein